MFNEHGVSFSFFISCFGVFSLNCFLVVGGEGENTRPAEDRQISWQERQVEVRAIFALPVDRNVRAVRYINSSPCGVPNAWQPTDKAKLYRAKNNAP